MKYIEFYESFNPPVSYKFTLGGLDFLVEFTRNKNRWNLSYYSWDDSIGDWSVSKLINSNPYLVIDKVFGEILNEFIRDHNPREIYIDGLSKDLEKSYVSQRTKMYLRYLLRNTPRGYSVKPSSLSNMTSNRISLEKL